MPAVQFEHAVDDAPPAENWPASQMAHSAEPSTSEYLPGWQTEQLYEPTAEYWPLGQVRHEPLWAAA